MGGQGPSLNAQQTKDNTIRRSSSGTAHHGYLLLAGVLLLPWTECRQVFGLSGFKSMVGRVAAAMTAESQKAVMPASWQASTTKTRNQQQESQSGLTKCVVYFEQLHQNDKDNTEVEM